MKQQYQIGDTIAGSDGYYRVVADGVKGMRLQFDRPYIAGEIVPQFGTVVPRQPAQVGVGGTNSKRVVLVHHANGTTETDAHFWARQEELADYAATVDAASYRGQ